MNILTDELPNELLICDKKCPIRSDFKTWIKVSSIMLAEEIDIEIALDLISLIFFELPPNLEATMKAIMWFYSPPKRKSKRSSQDEKNEKRVFDYEADADYIYSAFMQQYGIDLCKADLHWWQFKALFDGLTDETLFSKIVHYRGTDLGSIKDKEMKKHYRKMKNAYKLPDNRTQEQKERDFNENISALF